MARVRFQSIIQTKENAAVMAEQYHHPSEFLEFATVPEDMLQPKSSDDAITELPDAPRSDSTVIMTKSNTEIFSKLCEHIPGFRKLSQDAQSATESEHQMTLVEGLKLYPKAIGWSILLSLTIVMEGFDLTLLNSFYAFPEFKRRYGEPTRDGQYQITTAWQAALSNGAVIGEIFGLLCYGIFTDWIGNRYTMIGSLALLTCFIFVVFFAQNLEMLLASQFLCGVPWGVFQTLSTTYAAEVMPVALRAYVTSNVNNCWLIGQIISACMLRSLISNTTEWSYRLPFALQWMWTLPILIGVVFAPESPWWLIQHDRLEDAKKALLRLTKAGSHIRIDETVAMLKHTNEVEKYLSDGTSFLDCFKGTDLRRTEIVSMVWISQAVCGAFTGYAAYFYVQAGLPDDRAFDLSIIMYAAGLLGGIVACFLMRIAGRRTLYIYGCFGCAIALLAAGIVGTLPESRAVSWAVGSLIVLNVFIYDSTIGPVCYSLVAEIPATRLRAKTVGLGRVMYNVVTVVISVLLPKMLNPTAWDLKGRSCYLFAILSFLCTVWCYFRLPEPKGLTYMELDILFEKRADARKFKRFQSKLANSGYFYLNENGAVGPDEQWSESYRAHKVGHIS